MTPYNLPYSLKHMNFPCFFLFRTSKDVGKRPFHYKAPSDWYDLPLFFAQYYLFSYTDSPSLLILLDLPADFDTVDHAILLERLQKTVGLSGSALQWFQSYLSDRTEYLSLGGSKSRLLTVSLCPAVSHRVGPRAHPLYHHIIYMLPSVVSSADMGYPSIAMLMTHNSTSVPLLPPLQPCLLFLPVSRR